MTRATPKKQHQTKAAHAGRAIEAPAGNEAPQGRAAQPEHPLTAMIGKLHLLCYELADLAPGLGEHLLTAARVIKGVRQSLETPKDNRRLLNRAAAMFGRSDLPHSFSELKPAAIVLVDAVERAQRDPDATDNDIAEHLEITRTVYATRGTKRLLTHDGTAQERIVLFTAAIKKLRDRTDGGGKVLDPKAVISACARECGNRRELFGASRKSVRRSGQE